MSIELPNAETLYHHFLAGWISPEDPRDRILRSDLEQIELEAGQHIRILSPLNQEGQNLMRAQLERTRQAARADLSAMLELAGEPEAAWLDRLEAHVTPERLQQWLRMSNAEKPDNPWFVLCCETGSLIADVLQSGWPRLQWLLDTPYFESDLFDLNARVRIPVFHWAVKALSGDDTQPLTEKVEATLELLQDPSRAGALS